MSELWSQFPLRRAALSTSGRAKSKFISVRCPFRDFISTASLFLVLTLLCPGMAPANPPRDGSVSASPESERQFMTEIDSPNPIDRARIMRRLQEQQARRALRPKAPPGRQFGEGIEPFGLAGTDRVLVILVEFVGTNQFTWTPGSSTWDPLGRCDNTEFDGSNLANSAASTFFAQKCGITAPTSFTYVGPLHNEIQRPSGINDPSETMIWMPDFSPGYYSNIIFGNGVVFDYARQDGSVVHEDFTGKSVRDYYEDLSGGAYSLTGTILGWIRVTNSVWYYGGDGLPGARSTSLRPAFQGAIPGAGDSRSLVIDALNSAKAAYPDLDWASFDQNGDGLIDRLWIIHAGLGEEDNPALLNRTPYGEGGMWSHSWSLSSPYQVAPGVSAYSYIMMPENAGIAVLAHEFGHNLGAIDLYTYGDGQTSAGFWTTMSDDWVGFPLGFLPQAMDPMHLDQWGWLTPLLVNDPTQVYSVKLGQASRFPATSDLVRAVRIELPANGSSHNYYLQWRNTTASGGYDQALGDTRFRFGPANTGLLVWYQNDRYYDNSIANYLTDPPSFGPKGKLLVVDSHPEPYLDPYWLAHGVSNELGIVFSRGSMRDAPFSRWPTLNFHLKPPFAYEEADFPGRPAAPQFSDTLGYYPGIQNLATSLWRTWQWDSSVVLPSTQSYGVLGPGYVAGTPLQNIIATRVFIGTNEVVSYGTNWFSSGLDQAGADGNPGTANGQYGWNVRIVCQTDSWAEIVIWNSHYDYLDDDGDGVPNWQEAVAGTDPKDARSFLRFTSASLSPVDGRLLLEWTSATNRTYTVLRASSLRTDFQSIATNLPASPPLNSFLVPNSGPSSATFYRLQVE
jgi:M6 family metalloprotease-like protein